MTIDDAALRDLALALKAKARDLGFQQLGISDTDLDRDRAYLDRWLELMRHGDMGYMARHGSRRTTPEALVPGTVRVVAARMDYLPEPGAEMERALRQPARAYIARYALGRDYHKLLRNRLKHLAEWLRSEVGNTRYRVFVDSAPVMERALARRSGLVVSARRDLHRSAAALRRARQRALRQLPRLHRRLPDPGDPRALRARCAALHFLSNDRAQGRDSRRAQAADRQPDLRLRRLSARLSLESIRETHHRGRLQAEARTRRCGPRRSHGLERERMV